MTRLLLTALLLVAYSGAICQPDTEVTHTIFLVGDGGEPYVKDDPLSAVIRACVKDAGEKTTVLYLGDNVYPKGLAYEGERLREQGEEILKNQVNWIKGLPAKGYFIPGNHDWHHWGRKGLEYIQNQQRWLDSLRDARISLIPRDGCPGPVTINLDDQTLLVIIDTQWILHEWDKPGEESSCQAKTIPGLLAQLHDVFETNKTKRIIVAAHHPLRTYGEHGGVFPFKAHIFPLEELSDHLYVPMPLLGSFYPLYRKWFGHLQDTPHPVYKEFSRSIEAIMEKYPGSVYVAGHEHALEYIRKDSSHFIVSGSAAKTEGVRKKDYAVFARDIRGFVVLKSYSDGKLSMHFIQVDGDHAAGEEVFSRVLSKTADRSDKKAKPARSRGNAKARAANDYSASGVGTFLRGDNYRKEWNAQVTAPYLTSTPDSLHIVRREGDATSMALRLRNKYGHEFKLQPMKRHGDLSIPEAISKQFGSQIIPDQVTALHPYAPTVVSALAAEARILHTTAKLLFIPDDTTLLSFKAFIGNKLAYIEEMPEGDWSTQPSFANSRRIINTTQLLRQLQADNNNRVDERLALRSRLFDLIIGDWVTHDDQWRWALTPEDGVNIYRPIPRDRDHAFFMREGFTPALLSRRWAMPQLEGFDTKIDWPSGLSYTARHFDRSFLTTLDQDDWRVIASELKDDLTDAAIDSAINLWPSSITQLHGKSIAAALRARRDNVVADAISHYQFLAKEVDVVASDKREHFNIKQHADGNVEVDVTTSNRLGNHSTYHRLFKQQETHELRLYGLGGDDTFTVSGNHLTRIRIRIIGGVGQDSVIAVTAESGRRIYFYDQFAGSQLVGKFRDRRSGDEEINRYDRKHFQYDRTAPTLFLNYNADDGFSFGGGVTITSHGFRKHPFKQKHEVAAYVAPLTSSGEFRYHGMFTEVIGKLDVDLNLSGKPNYVNNFFGIGNSSIFEREGQDANEAIDFYRYTFTSYSMKAMLVRKFSNWGSIGVGPFFQQLKVEPPGSSEEKYISQHAISEPDDIFRWHRYGGATWRAGIDRRNDLKHTLRGVTIKASGIHLKGLSGPDALLSSYDGSLALYYTFYSPRNLTLANRTGGGLNTRKYPFYFAQILDGKTELRGYRKNRFYGDQRFYNNFEARFSVAKFRSYLSPTTLGILAFSDIGRVWSGSQAAVDSDKDLWHHGWGGGVWFTPFNFGVVSTEIARSGEDVCLYVRLGFLF
jgi:hypothetical protein